MSNTGVTTNPSQQLGAPTTLPNSPTDQAECDRVYFTRIRLGWMWKGGPAINGGSYYLYSEKPEHIVGQNPPQPLPDIASGEFTGDIVEFELPFRKACFLEIRLGNGGRHLLHLYPDFDLEALPGVSDTQAQLKMMQARLRNLGIQIGDVNGSYTDRTRWAVRWFQRRLMALPDANCSGKPDTSMLANLYNKHEDVIIPMSAVLDQAATGPTPHASHWLFETDINKYSPTTTGFGMLYRKKAQVNNVGNNDPLAFDHDPVTGSVNPVWTGVRHHCAFPVHVDQPGDAAYITQGT